MPTRVLQNVTKFEFDIWYLINLLHLLYKAKEVLVEVSQSLIMLNRFRPPEVSGVTFKGRKISFLKYTRFIHQKKRLEPLMIKRKSVL